MAEAPEAQRLGASDDQAVIDEVTVTARESVGLRSDQGR
jgi:hypothetical protein